MALTLKAMQYFTTALRHGNITKAAQELNIAASAVASAIDQVEAHFDLTLTNRHRSRGIRATASGNAIAARFERLLDDYRAVLQDGAALKQTLSGTLRVGYYAPVAPAFLPQILSDAALMNADVTLHLEACDNDSAQTGLLDGTYDAILFVSNGARSLIEYDVLIEAPAYCLLPRAHPLSANETVSLRQLARQRIVRLDRPFAADYYRALFETQGVTPRVVAHANSTEMVRSLVGAGFGCAVLNMVPRTVQTYAGDHVVALPLSDPLPPLCLAIGYAKQAPRRLVDHFANACRAHFEMPGSGQCIVRAG